MASEGAEKGGWRRPDNAGPYPREWDRFQGLKPMEDGRVPTFWIRDVTPDMADAVVEHMVRYYMPEEQMAMSARTLEDAQSAGEMEAMWRDAVVRTRVSLAAFTDWPHGEERLAGFNLLGVVRREDPPMMMDGPRTRPMFLLMNEMLAEADVFKRYGVKTYMVGLGLTMHPDFRGQGVALRLLRAREPLCAALRIPLTVTAFSGAQSQKQAQRAGFEVLSTRRYTEFAIEDGVVPFKDATWTHIEVQAKFYGPRDDEEQ